MSVSALSNRFVGTLKIISCLNNNARQNVAIHFIAAHRSSTVKTDPLSPPDLSAAILAERKLKCGIFGLPNVCLLQRSSYASNARSVKIPPTKHLDFDHSGDGEKQKEQNPKELLEVYRSFGKLNNVPESVRKLFTVEFASGREKLQNRKIITYEKVNRATGMGMNLEKQIAHMTVKIRNLIPYCLAYRKDKVAKCHLNERIQMRKKLLKYLRRLDYEKFMWLLKELKISYVPYPRYNYKLSRRARRKKEAREELLSLKRKKIRELEEVLEKEKVAFHEHKTQVMAEIQKTIAEYNLDMPTIRKRYTAVENKTTKE